MSYYVEAFEKYLQGCVDVTNQKPLGIHSLNGKKIISVYVDVRLPGHNIVILGVQTEPNKDDKIEYHYRFAHAVELHEVSLEKYLLEQIESHDLGHPFTEVTGDRFYRLSTRIVRDQVTQACYMTMEVTHVLFTGEIKGKIQYAYSPWQSIGVVEQWDGEFCFRGRFDRKPRNCEFKVYGSPYIYPTIDNSAIFDGINYGEQWWKS